MPDRLRFGGADGDDLEVDVDGLRDRPAEVADAAASRSPARWPNGALTVVAVGTWNSGRRRVQARNFATSSAWPPPSPTIAAARGQPRLELDQLRQLQRLDEVDPGEVRPGQPVLEPRPEVGHRDDEVRPVDERRQLADELVPEDRPEALRGERRGVGRAVGAAVGSVTASSRRARS